MITVDEHYIDDLYVREYLPSHENKKNEAVLFLHGYPGSQKNYDIAEHLALKGFNGYVVHYRGSWKSKGKYSLFSNYKDVELILKYIEGKVFSYSQISLIGNSWGGFLGLEIFAVHPNLSKFIMLAPFININQDQKKLEAGAHFLSSVTRPYIKNYEKSQIMMDLVEISRTHNPLDKISNIDGKRVLIIHGEKDHICPIEYSRELKHKFKTPARLIELPLQDHFLHNRELLYEFCFGFLNE